MQKVVEAGWRDPARCERNSEPDYDRRDECDAPLALRLGRLLHHLQRIHRALKRLAMDLQLEIGTIRTKNGLALPSPSWCWIGR